MLELAFGSPHCCAQVQLNKKLLYMKYSLIQMCHNLPRCEEPPVCRLNEFLLGLEEVLWALEDLRTFDESYAERQVCVRVHTERHTHIGGDLNSAPS